MTTVADVADFLEAFAPASLAEEWDNVGLLVGDRQREATRIMTCLTVTPSSAAEAIAQRAHLIVTHHPFPFRPLNRLTSDTPEGRMLLDLIGAGISIFSPHTAFDSAAAGINQRLAEGLELVDIEPLVPVESAPAGAGGGRHGRLAAPLTLDQLAARVKKFLAIERVQVVGEAKREVRQVAVACGSAGEFLSAARALGCDCLVTGETRFHTCVEAEATGIGLLLAGHFASERFGVERLADVLARQFSTAHVWACCAERDPLRWV
jgi:dinuclear metal center YbgI/SA1388 family protein